MDKKMRAGGAGCGVCAITALLRGGWGAGVVASLKTHHKKQFRTERGLENQMKLSSMKRAGILGKCKDTILNAFSRFIPFLSPG